jgi:hypothetical protein
MRNGDRFLSLILCLLLPLGGCKRSQHPSDANLDACSLITREEVNAVQGSSVADTKSSLQVNQGFRVSQCFYTAKEFSKSVVLSVTQRDSEHPADQRPKDFWNRMFHRDAQEKEEREGGREENEGAAATKIEGLGDEAFWTGARFGGALYVLKDNIFFRISVGGVPTEQGKIDNSKALARKALSRL